jgi:dipeptidyl aminopeptidase/acylaminoacyl peptidase
VTPGAPSTPFHDLAAFTALPRCAGLVLSPDGTRLVTVVSTPDPDGTRYRSALWEIDPTGARPARRLTRGDPGEHDAVFTPAGDLLFLSARPAPGADDDDPPDALWLLPAGGGEATLVGTRPGGLGGPVVARRSGAVVCTSATLPGAVTAADDAARRSARTAAKVTAILHEGPPVRFWDHDLGPARPRLVTASPSAEPVGWTDLTPAPGGALEQAAYDVTPDGATVVTTWQVDEPRGAARQVLVAVTAPGERRVLLDDPGHTVDGPVAVSPDGRWVACLRTRRATATEPSDVRCVVVPLGGGEPRDVAPGWDRWVTALAWTPDSADLVVAADDAGCAPLHRVDLAGGTPVRLTDDHGAYSDPVVGPDGTVYALRSAVDAPPAPVRIDPGGTVVRPIPTPLPPPAPAPTLPGSLTEVTTTAGDGTPLRAWLVLPESTTPAPLLLWIHGGPVNSWNGWHWRWNPWIMAAHGYAVLLPDPALSTGYGRAFVARGWGRWGAEPYTDLLALTDAAERLPEIDATRTAAMGGSFGGYMANWIAGHTDRFAAIVTHASLWALDQFVATTDRPDYWRRELTPSVQDGHSPHRHADAITTPMLVIHGDRDHRVPIGEALRLWSDLVIRCSERVPHKFLYFPDENHWVLRPSHVRLWYATVLAFLDHHLHGADWVVPDLLR